MIGDFGILSTGLAVKRISDITQQMNDSLAGDLGASFNLLPQTPEGQLVNRMAEQVADLWEFGEQAYNSLYPDTASGISLDNARALTNNFRIPATASVANGVVLTGTAGTVVPAGTQVSVDGSPASVFQSMADATLNGAGMTTASFVCMEPGPVIAPATKLNTITTAVPGLSSVSNPSDAEIGTLAETDAAFRLRSAQELSSAGTGTFSGLLKSVQSVTNVSRAYEFINDADYVDVNLLPPHSVQLVVVGGIDSDIANAIFSAKGAGIQTNGSTSLTVNDSQGTAHIVNFSRLTQVPIYMVVQFNANSNPSLGPVYPGNGDTLMATAILALGSAYLPGQTVITNSFLAPVNSIPGVINPNIYISTTNPPSDVGSGTNSPNITLPVYNVAQFLSANLTVTHL